MNYFEKLTEQLRIENQLWKIRHDDWIKDNERINQKLSDMTINFNNSQN